MGCGVGLGEGVIFLLWGGAGGGGLMMLGMGCGACVVARRDWGGLFGRLFVLFEGHGVRWGVKC